MPRSGGGQFGPEARRAPEGRQSDRAEQPPGAVRLRPPLRRRLRRHRRPAGPAVRPAHSLTLGPRNAGELGHAQAVPDDPLPVVRTFVSSRDHDPDRCQRGGCFGGTRPSQRLCARAPWHLESHCCTRWAVTQSRRSEMRRTRPRPQVACVASLVSAAPRRGIPNVSRKSGRGNA